MINSFLFIFIFIDYCVFMSVYVTYLELAAPMLKAFYPEYMLFVNNVELSLIIDRKVEFFVISNRIPSLFIAITLNS